MNQEIQPTESTSNREGVASPRASVCSSSCPFDFLTDFEGWFHWHKCVHFDKLTPEQATTNVKAVKAGWVLCRGMKYGGWTYPNAYRQVRRTIGYGRLNRGTHGKVLC